MLLGFVFWFPLYMGYGVCVLCGVSVRVGMFVLCDVCLCGVCLCVVCVCAVVCFVVCVCIVHACMHVCVFVVCVLQCLHGLCM